MNRARPCRPWRPVPRVRNEPLQRRLIGFRDWPRGHSAGRAVLGAKDRRLIDRAAAGERLPLRLGHVLALPADIGLVGLDRAGERRFGLLKRLPQPVRQMPGRLLRHFEIPMQFHRRHALEARRHQIDRDRPRLVAELRALHDVSHLEAEPRLAVAVATAVRHRLVPDISLDVEGATARAVRAVRPDLRFEPPLGRGIVREHLHELLETDAFAVGFSGCLHDPPPVALYCKADGRLIQEENGTLVYNPQIIAPKTASGSDEARDLAFRSINSKCLDFLINDHSCLPALAVEYQGHGHYQNRAFMRDAVKREAVRKAKVKFLEIPAEYDARVLEEQIRSVLLPNPGGNELFNSPMTKSILDQFLRGRR